MAMSLFHVDNGGSLNPLRATSFGSHEELQSLIAAHPALLGGDPEAGGGWFALARTSPLPETAAGAFGWSVEHLFLAADAAPTIVEALSAGETRAHGDLFGQILYYAANAALWWPRDSLRAAAEVAQAPSGIIESEAFWDQVEANLAAGRVRMVLVVEEVAPDLARMVDFLNAQLRDAELWILEVRQLSGPSGRLLQAMIAGRRGEAPAARAAERPPRAKGAADGVAVARAVRSPTPAPAVAAARADAASREAWIASLRSRCDEDEAAVLDDLLRWMGEQYGATSVTGPPLATYRLAVRESGKDRYPFGVTETKTAAIYLGDLSGTRAYESEEARRSLIHEIAATGLSLAEVDPGGDLRIPLKDLVAASVRGRMLAVFDDVIETLRLKEAPGLLS